MSNVEKEKNGPNLNRTSVQPGIINIRVYTVHVFVVQRQCHVQLFSSQAKHYESLTIPVISTVQYIASVG